MILKKIDFLWQKFFGREMGENSKLFLKNLSFSFFGGLGAFAGLFAINILAARFLGPEEYGKYSFFSGLAIALSTFLVLEADSGVAFFLAKAKKQKQKDIISSMLILFFGIFAVLSVFLYFFRVNIATILNHFVPTDSKVLIAILGLTLVFSLKKLLEGFLKGKKLFLKQSAFKIVEVLAVTIIFLVLYKFFEISTYFDYFQAIFWGALAVIVVTIFSLRTDIHWTAGNLPDLQKIYTYSKWGFINSASAIILRNIDKFLILIFFDMKMVGIYAAYYTASMLPAMKIGQLLINVYFPSISAGVNTKSLYKKVVRFSWISFFPILLSASASVYVLLLFFGSKYPTNYLWISLLGFYVTIHLLSSIVSWTVAGSSEQGFDQYNKGIFWGLVIFVVMLAISILVHRFSISFLIFSFTANRAVVGVYSFIKFKKLIKKTTL